MKKLIALVCVLFAILCLSAVDLSAGVNRERHVSVSRGTARAARSCSGSARAAASCSSRARNRAARVRVRSFSSCPGGRCP